MAEETGMFTEFPTPTYEEWREAAEKSLKGAPFEKKLLTRTYEDITLQPLYRQDEGEGLPHLHTLPGFPPYVRGTNAAGYHAQPWEICQEIPYPMPDTANKTIRFDLEHGQTAINLLLDTVSRNGRDANEASPYEIGEGGVSISTTEDLATIFEGIDLEQVPLFIQSSAYSLPLLSLLLALLRQQGKDPATLRGCIGTDPLGTLASTGTLPGPLDDCYDGMAWIAEWRRVHMPDMQTILVQGHPYHNGGASTTQELAFALATAVEYLRAMQTRNIPIDEAAEQIRFSFSIGSNFFMEIARLRAARMLWATIVNAFGGSEAAQKMIIHVRTSTWNKTACDPYVNMLRTTTEALSGILGGCASMHVGPFDEVVRTPDDFSRRIARNTQIILQQESHMGRVIDPAGGSWYVEHLTDAIAQKTWSIFQEVEKQGGMFQSLQAGYPQSQVAQVAQQRAKNIAHRRDIFVGTNMYPDIKARSLTPRPLNGERILDERTETLREYRARRDPDLLNVAMERLRQATSAASTEVIEATIKAALAGATLSMLTSALRTEGGAIPTIEPVEAQRGAEPFEILRSNAEAYQLNRGYLPQVFLANMGPIPQHKPRADFTIGFFAAGGFEAITNNGFATPEEAARAAIESYAPIVVICSTDETYPDIVPPLTRLIKASRPETIVALAGYPQDQIEAHKAAGVDEFIHLRANCYEILAKFQQQLGIGEPS